MVTKDARIRKLRYERLRGLGFNSYDANRYKDLSKEKYDKIIKAKRTFNEIIRLIIYGG